MVALLAINDHILKPELGGWLTGKLSDAAGVFIVAVVVGVLTNRPRLASVLTAIGFTLLKTVPAVTYLAAPVLGGLTRTDPSDLLGLVAIWPAQRVLEGCLRPATAIRIAASSTWAALGLTAAGLAISATSCLAPPTVDALLVRNNQVYARVRAPSSAGYGDEVHWATTSDGDRWRPIRRPPGSDIPPEGGPADGHDTRSCQSDLCFRIVDGERVETRKGAGAWTPSFAFTAEQRRRRNLRADSECVLPHYLKLQWIGAVTMDDGLHVFVGAASQGVLHRSPDGKWHRRAVLETKPMSLSGPSWLAALRWSPLLLAALALAISLVSRARGRRLEPIAWLIAIGGAVNSVVLAEMLLVYGVDYVPSGLVIAGVALAIFISSLACTLAGSRRHLVTQALDEIDEQLTLTDPATDR